MKRIGLGKTKNLVAFYSAPCGALEAFLAYKDYLLNHTLPYTIEHADRLPSTFSGRVKAYAFETYILVEHNSESGVMTYVCRERVTY